MRTATKSPIVLVRPLHPHERLDIDHVARTEIAKVTPNDDGELKEAGIRVSTRAVIYLFAYRQVVSRV